MIDLRSDTVTRPSPAMRAAMASAEVGDDVYREDPTVNLLEARAASLLGKEAGLFVPSGTMGNTIAIKLHTEHGQEVICDSRSHILDYELAMMAWFCGCVPRAVPSESGILKWDQIRAAYRPLGPHWAPTGLICLENTHNMGGGTVYPMALLDQICDQARELGLRVHLDGARVFNAAVALGVPVKDVTARMDTVMFCLSKGLGAPIGSVLVGRFEDIDRGRLLRKRLGGGMRQAGILAAAGLMALEENPAKLHEDHRNARLLANALSEIPGIQIDPGKVHTNILIFDVNGTGMTTQQYSAALKARGVLANGISPSLMRMVTHMDVSAVECETAIAATREIAEESFHE